MAHLQGLVYLLQQMRLRILVLNLVISYFLLSFLNASLYLVTLFIIELNLYNSQLLQKPSMNSFLNYEILINLKSMDILCIRQSSFYQIRLTVYQIDNKNKNVFAVPFLMLKSQIEVPSRSNRVHDANNTSEIDHGNNSFLTRKFIVRNIDEKLQINEMCIFKGSLLTNNNGEDINNQIKIYVELLSYQQNDIDVVQEWTGSTLKYTGNSYCPIYFNSYKFTCNINSSVHLIVSSLSIQNLTPRTTQANSKLDNVSYYKKFSRFLEESIEMLKNQIKVIKPNFPKATFEQEYQCPPGTYRYLSFWKVTKQLKEAQVKDIQKNLNKLQGQDCLDKLKQALNLLNQAVYQFWKKYQIVLTKCYSQSYQKIIKSQYYGKLQQHHEQNNLLIEQTGTPWSSSKTDGLFMYPFERHQTYLKLKKKDMEAIKQQKTNSNRVQLLILVHGYQASSFDMEPISNYLKYKNQNVLCLLSTVNQGKTQQQIEQSAHRLAIQIKNYINSLQLKDFQISFMCHSLGGIIGRACLKYLQLHKDKFNQFVSLCSPHLGYLYHSSTLISTSLWILNKVKKDPSMIELTMQDNSQLQKTYIYQTSRNKELNWFKKIWLFGSKEDQYVPYWSAVLQDKYFYFQTSSSKLYKSMLQNLTKDIQGKIIRCEIIFNQKAKDISNFIGRTAHIKILNFIPGLQLLSSVFTP